MVSFGTEQLRHRGVHRQQEGRTQLRTRQKQGSQNAVGIQQDDHRQCQEE